jgi:hypothetical protein
MNQLQYPIDKYSQMELEKYNKGFRFFVFYRNEFSQGKMCFNVFPSLSFNGLIKVNGVLSSTKKSIRVCRILFLFSVAVRV